MSKESIQIILDRLAKLEDRMTNTQITVGIGVGIISTIAFLAGILLK